ncbi:hypothetical protein GKC29_14880 [Micromonospora sp. WMMC415]|uniref:hypothetical protein n=1 Tax=Micromonospora sp. WMMC415 TaxID=2675222 RepID=UPI0012B4DE39|nr:hypothetical protein [Micromonospora sp. WMMC415]QGN48002.1 hypothetical protein GKC29_14880 [Micromonospora sp. WMMC415]
MTELFAPRAAVVPPADLHLGQAVHVNARTVWLLATVTSITHTRIGVAYGAQLHASSPLADAVAPWVVRPADGVRLQAVHELRAGDDVVAFDGTTLTIAAVWQGRDGWWVIDYITGERASVPPNAILRLTDPSPTVSVNGIPL